MDVFGNNYFHAFLFFARADKRLMRNEKHIRVLFSIGEKLEAVKITLDEFMNQIPAFQKENDELHKIGYVSGIERIKIGIKYESYLNSIYSLFENIAYIISRLYDDVSVPRTFDRQKKRFLKDDSINPDYSKLLNELVWYDEVKIMRAECTHFLSGIVTTNKLDLPGYYNLRLSERNSEIDKIDIEDIKNHGMDIYRKLMEYLDKTGNILLNLLDGDRRVTMICGITEEGPIGAKNISYNEMKSGKPGVCHTYAVDCPKASDCPARKQYYIEKKDR